MKTLFGCLISLLICLQVVPAWAAIGYVGAQAAGVLGTTTAITVTFTSLTGGLAAAPAVGDTVVVTWCTVSINLDRALTITNASSVGYTLLGSESYADDNYDTNMRSAYRVMPDPVETQLILSSSDGGTGSAANGGSYSITVLRGVHATPLEQVAQSGTGINTILVNPGSITPTTTGTVVYVSGCGANDVGGTYTSSDLTDFRAVNGVDNEDSVLGSGYFAWTSGTFAPATFAGITDNVQFSHAWTIAAFAPAPDGAACRGALMLMGMGGC